MSRPTRPIEITETQHAEIRSLLRQRNLPAAHAQRVRAAGGAALADRPKAGRPRRYGGKIRAKIAAMACQPPPGSNRWTVRALATKLRVPKSLVHDVLQREQIQPHRIRYYMHSSDPQFETKLADVVGLYLDPPENAVVLCVDEKTGIQALDRTQPQLPLRPGQVTRLSVEYKRNGVVSLFAALQVRNRSSALPAEIPPTHAGRPTFSPTPIPAFQGREL